MGNPVLLLRFGEKGERGVDGVGPTATDVGRDPHHAMAWHRVVVTLSREHERVGRPVDLRTYGDLRRYFRDHVVAQARPIYAA